MHRKGLVLDDTTFRACPEKIMGAWPNTNEKVVSIRSYAPWRSFWSGGEEARRRSNEGLINFVKENNVQVLIGQDVTCNRSMDDAQWVFNIDLIKRLGKKHIMGLAIGNEMDILKDHPTWLTPTCLADLWTKNGFYDVFKQRVEDMDRILGVNEIKVTTVWTMGAPYGNLPFREDPGRSMVNTFVTQAFKDYGARFVWSFNPYPLWSSPLCHLNVEESNVVAANQIVAARVAIHKITNNFDDPLWAAEMGWSNPLPQGLPDTPLCRNFTSKKTFASYYEDFLQWDLSVSECSVCGPWKDKMRGPDHAFFFTMRDSYNGAASEHFGLVSECSSTRCKIDGEEAMVTI